MASLVHYAASQQVAVQLDDDGCGFCYYESGRLAVCVNKVNEYQRRFQFYADNAAKTLLAALDEHAVGSAARPKGKKLLLTKDGGMLLDASDQITQNWRWNPKAGSPPQEPVVIQLNDVLRLTFTDRHDIVVQFAPAPGVAVSFAPGVAVSFACGERLRRFDSYLDHARRASDGQLVVEPHAPTLQQRQKQIEREAIEKRSRAKPRSQDLGHERIKAVVASLETAFDGYEGCQVTPCVDGNWEETAQLQSLREIPRLPPTGTEIGDKPTSVEPHDNSASLQRLQHAETGHWLGSVELHERILQENPSLARKGALSVASGRYARELPVAGYVNGRKPSRGTRLRLVPAVALDRFLREDCPRDALVVVACLRADDPQSCAAELLLEQVHARLNELDAATEFGAKCRLVKCDLAESSLLADRFRVHAAPTFLLFYDARLIHVSSLGGAARRVFPATTNAQLSGQLDALPRVLLVEPVARHQLAAEKVLRKESFLWDLALGGDQAVAFFSRPPLRGHSASSSISVVAPCPYGLVMVSDMLGDADLRAIGRLMRAKDKGSGGALLCAVVSSPRTDVQFALCADCRRAQGRRVSAEAAAARDAACPHCGFLCVEANASVVSPVLAEVAHVLVYKHVKSATLHRLAERWAARTHTGRAADASFTGLTVDSFFREIQTHYAAAKRGVVLPAGFVPGMALSVVDAVLPVTAVASSLRNPRSLHNSVVNLQRASSA